MSRSVEQRYHDERENIHESDALTGKEKQYAIEFLNAHDPERMTSGSDVKTKAYSTLSNYAQTLRSFGGRFDQSLIEASAYDINRTIEKIRTGSHEDVKDEGLSYNSVRSKQNHLRKFYGYHDDLIDKDEIHLLESKETSVDDRDMFTQEEVHELRKHAGNARNKALLDLFIYTGQRHSAIQNLRLKDVKPEEGIFYLNEEDGELKGAKGKRPLLGARKSVREYKRQHRTGEPEDYLITNRQKWGGRDDINPGDKLSKQSINQILKRIADKAGIDKPVNPHNFRHYFVTVCKRDYNLDDGTIKHLIGHAPDSDVMETTYAHLTDEDYIEKAEVGADMREEGNETPLTPPVCEICEEPLQQGWKVCPNCGEKYAPDAQDASEQAHHDAYETAKRADDEQTKDDLDTVVEALEDNPEVVEQLADKLADD